MSKGPKERLLEAKDLYEMGVLTEDEYGEIKRECIVQMKGMTTTPPPSHFPQSSSIILDAMLSKTLLIQNILQQVGWVSFESVLLPPGSFMMGAKEGDFDDEDDEDDAQPRHEVELSSGFWMMSTPVTQDLYESLMNNNPSEFKGGRRPVEYVSWFDAVQCANALSRKQGLKEVYTIDGEDVEADWSANGWRLPTEAEWEYAARAGTDFKYSGSNNLDEVGWHSGNSGGQTHPVGEKKPNGWGLYDMSGNVYEWCWDWYGDYPSSKQVDPKGPKSDEDEYKILRGGVYCNHLSRVSWRSADEHSGRYGCGFRLVSGGNRPVGIVWRKVLFQMGDDEIKNELRARVKGMMERYSGESLDDLEIVSFSFTG